MSDHLHKFEVECSYSGIHMHTIKGYVKNIFGIGRFHFHFYYGVSSYLDHTHYFTGITGIPIQLKMAIYTKCPDISNLPRAYPLL